MRKTACAVVMAGLISTSAMAQDATAPGAQAQPAAAAPEAKRFTTTGGVDFMTAYMFRGIRQEDHGTIVPPYVDLGIAVGKGVSLNVGTWNSLHSGPSGHSGKGNAWYEADYYGSATFTAGKFKPGVLFTSYTSPNDAFGTVHELAGVLAYDDSASAFPLSPKVMVATELEGQADGGTGKGTYLELGIRPGLKAAPALTFYVPVKVGLSLNDYYEGPTGSNRFGYFDTGVLASVPLGFLSGTGTWEAHAGVNFLWLGDNMKALNSGDGFKPVGVFGVSFAY
jgi:Bacterial protein of unknown function (Gcw_chp)